MRIAHVSSEVAPYSQTGGLAQVAAALPEALAALDDQQVSIFTPLYGGVHAVLEARGESLSEPHGHVSVPYGGRSHDGYFRSLVFSNGLQVHFFCCPSLFGGVGIYSSNEGDSPDNAERFSTFSQAT